MKIKHISSFCFIIAFLMSIVLFGGIGEKIISPFKAKYIFIISGILGMILNLISYKTGKDKKEFNFWFWLGSIIISIGLMFKMMNWPYSLILIIIGGGIAGFSFFYSPILDSEKEDSGLLDDPKE